MRQIVAINIDSHEGSAMVWVHRQNGHMGHYCFGGMEEKQISFASLLRAQRAQLVLAKRHCQAK